MRTIVTGAASHSTNSRLLPLLTVVIASLLAHTARAAADPSASRASHPTRRIELSACALPGIPQPARCGTLVVSENPDLPAGRRLSIGVAVIPAIGQPARADPIVPLMGGPGEDAISAAELYSKQFESLRQDRDILLVDQRGTGRSGALNCELFSSRQPAASLRDLFPEAAVERCARRLRRGADLTQYTYDRFGSDLEQIRRALGYGPLNLFSGSYGTRAAQVYLRMYRQSVRTAYLGSAVPLDVRNPLPFARTEQAALSQLFDSCAADPACHAAFPNLPDEFRQIEVRLASGPIAVSVPDQPGTVPLYGGRVAEWIRSKLYRPYSSAEIPWLIHRAYLGDWTPITEGIFRSALDLNSDLAFGLFLSITCSEDVAFISEEDVAAETSGTFLGQYRIRQQQAACRLWPKASLPKNYREPVKSSVPTVFASGDADGGTPLWYTEHVAKGFSNRQMLLMRGQGHTEWNDCVAHIYQNLVVTGTVEKEFGASCPPVPRPPFKIL
jgi:pimeloyl-ACP methyl ester carboxylesterase